MKVVQSSGSAELPGPEQKKEHYIIFHLKNSFRHSNSTKHEISLFYWALEHRILQNEDTVFQTSPKSFHDKGFSFAESCLSIFTNDIQNACSEFGDLQRIPIQGLWQIHEHIMPPWRIA